MHRPLRARAAHVVKLGAICSGSSAPSIRRKSSPQASRTFFNDMHHLSDRPTPLEGCAAQRHRRRRARTASSVRERSRGFGLPGRSAGDFRFLGNVFRTAQGVLPDTQALQHAPLSSRAEDSMPLDVLEADLVGLGSNSVGRGAPRYLDAQRLKFDLIVKVLPRDDPLRRSYIQRRWYSQAVGCCNIERTSSSPTALSRR